MMIRLTAAWLLAASLPCMADPLHAVGDDGTYRHEDSGWLFRAQVADFERVGSPYTIDGNADAGAHYQHEGVLIVVDVFARESFANDATVDGAKRTAAKAAGEAARATAEEAVALGSGADIHAIRVVYTLADKTGAVLYFAEKKPWTVKILVTGAQDAGAVDAFVRALPWQTLGADTSDLHGS